MIHYCIGFFAFLILINIQFFFTGIFSQFFTMICLASKNNSTACMNTVRVIFFTVIPAFVIYISYKIAVFSTKLSKKIINSVFEE